MQSQSKRFLNLEKKSGCFSNQHGIRVPTHFSLDVKLGSTLKSSKSTLLFFLHSSQLACDQYFMELSYS